MSKPRFCRYELRTTDTIAARAFYTDVVGADLWGPDVGVAPLPENAVARGARPHWLGLIGVDDVDATAGRIVERGGQPLGPTRRDAGGSAHAVFRDPFGAIVAVGSDLVTPSRAVVALHASHSQDHQQAFAWYAGLFGWTPNEQGDIGPHGGRYQAFAWDESGTSVGMMTNTVRLPEIHPQWLFFFRVRVGDLNDVLVRVRAAGCLVVGPTQTPAGDWVAACNDPQGGAFGLYQSGSGRP